MLLTIDVGNTNIVLGGYLNEELTFVSRISTNATKTVDEYATKIRSILALNEIPKAEIKGAIISSVVPPLNNILKSAVKKVYGVEPLLVGPGIKTGINMLVDDPRQVGADLITASVAAYEKFKAPVLIIDMGTATKMMLVDKNGAFLGVSIIPGVQIAVKALTSGTAQLPQISLDAPGSVIGKNTNDSMKSGVIYGNAALIDGMIDRIAEEFGLMPALIATGGVSPDIIPHCKHKIILDEYLILDGLRIIYNKNEKK